MSRVRVRLMLAAFVSVALLGACAPTNSKMAGKPHWVQDQRIRLVMSHLENDTVALSPREPAIPPPQSTPTDEYLMSIPKSRIEAIEEACILADSLAKSADAIESHAKAVKMNEADRRAFFAQIETLREQAKRLEERAAAKDFRGTHTAYAEVRVTCNACHTRFREIAGDLAKH